MAERRERHELGPAALPQGLRTDWPVPWQPVWGKSDGLFARLSCRASEVFAEGVARLPEPLFSALMGGIARCAKLVDRRHSEAARVFLRQALGELPRRELERRVLQSYRHFFRVLFEGRRFLRRVPVERTLERFEVAWSEEERRLVESETGCILVSCHVGNWEAGLAAMPWLGFDPVYGVAKPLTNRPMSVLAQRERERRGVRLLPRRGAMRDAPAVLRAGGALCMVLDQRARKRPVLVPFFGRPARCDRSAGVLMRRLKAPVLVTACFRTEEPLRYRFESFDLLRPEELASAGPAEIATRINQAFERMILRHPEQYHWIHDRFKDTPRELPEDIPGPEAGDSAAGPVSSEGGPSPGRSEVPSA